MVRAEQFRKSARGFDDPILIGLVDYILLIESMETPALSTTFLTTSGTCLRANSNTLRPFILMNRSFLFAS